MLIPVICKSCQSEYEVEAAEASPGMTLTCPECEAEIVIPKLSIGPGVTLGGFSIDRKLGEGAMGQVFLATQLSMDRQVALKILPPQFTIQEEAVSRFQQEVRMAAKVEHPNLVTAYEAGEDNGVYYMAIRYVDGMTVHEKIHKEGKMREKESLTIIRKVADALRVAWNKQQLLHRDIKPDNIMLEQDGEPRLTDLGLARSLNDNARLTVTAVAMGTPNYMSPEQIESASETDFRADIYSLGATLYNMLTGQAPFAGSTLTETLRKQLLEQLPDPLEANPDLSSGCLDIVELMLAKDKDDRYQSYEDLISDIDRVLLEQLPTANKLSGGKSVMLRSSELKKQLTQPAPPPRSTKGRGQRPLPHATDRKNKDSNIPMMVFLVVLVAAGIGALLLLKGQGSPEEGLEAAGPLEGTSILEEPSPTAETTAPKTSESKPPEVEIPPALQAVIDQLKKDNPGNANPQVLKDPKGLPVLDLTRSDIVNISALKGISINKIDLTETKVWDLSPLEGATVTTLILNSCSSLSDLSPLEKIKDLNILSLLGSKNIDLSPLAKTKLVGLTLGGGSTNDLSPLHALNLKGIMFANQPDIDLSPIATPGLNSVQLINSPDLNLGPIAKLEPQPKVEGATPAQRALMDRKGLTQEEYDLANAPPAQLKDFVNPILDALIRGDFDTAQTQLEVAEKEKDIPEAAAWKALHPSLKQTVNMKEYILFSYEALRRKSLTVHLNDGSKLLRIKKRDGDKIEAEVVIMRNGVPVASTPANFTYDNISTKEKLIRLGKEPDPVADVMKGLLALHADAEDSALKYFERSDNPTAKALLARMDTQVEEAAAVVKEVEVQRTSRERDQNNLKARGKFQAILTLLDIERLNKDPKALVEKLSNTVYSEEQIEQVKKLLAEIDAYGPDIPLKQKRLPVFEKLQLLNPHQPINIRKPDMDKALEAFNQANGGEVDFQQNDFVEGRITLHIRGDAKIRDLSPLKGLPIQNLFIGKSQISDLSPLQHMPLETLSLRSSPALKNIQALAQLPLKTLHLHGTQIKDFAPLAGLPLESLDLQSQKNIKTDLRPLRGLPLKKLQLNDLILKDIEALTGLPLEELSLRTLHHVVDLRPLIGMPLKKVNLDGVEVKSYVPLEGLKLENLRIYGARDFTSLEIVKNMPLTVLYIRNSPARDLSPLQGMQLKELTLIETPVKDLSPLKGLTQLRHLHLNNSSSLRDLSPLANLPISSLNISLSYISDLSPLAELPRLTEIYLDHCQKIKDLTPLSDLPIQNISLMGLKGLDLSPLRDTPLRNLYLRDCSNMDLSPLVECPIQFVDLRGTQSMDYDPLDKIPTLVPQNIRLR